MKAKAAPSALLKALSAALTYPAQGLESILEPLRCCAGDVSCTAWHAGLVEALAAAEAFTAPGAAQPEGAEAAQLEYTRLFIGSFKMCAPPYASYYLDGKSQVQGPTAVEATELYASFGLELAEGEHECADHIRYLLYFAAVLAQSHEERGLEEYALAYRDFCDAYVLNWLPQLQERVQLYAEFPFYPQVLELVSEVIGG